jgi:hypothetical protein
MAVQADISMEYSMGRQGFFPVTTTAAQTGNFSAVIPTEPTVFTSITGTGISGTWTGITLPAGFPLCGDITGFQLASGKAVAFLARTT